MNRPPRHRDTEPEDLSDLTGKIIRCAIEVHRVLGPGLLEAAYESALAELDDAGLRYVRQKVFPAFYKGRRLGQYQVDLIVEDLVVVEIKSVEVSKPLFEAQLLTYLRVSGTRVGLLINFNSRLLKDGVTRTPSAVAVARRREAADRPAPPVGRATSLAALCLCASVA
jgi:GxxExxY protein